MEFLQGIEFTQFLGVIVDFGFIGAFVAVMLWILARSPFQMELQFQGGIKIGKNGQAYGHSNETIQYGYTKQPQAGGQPQDGEQSEAAPALASSEDSFLGEGPPKARAPKAALANG